MFYRLLSGLVLLLTLVACTSTSERSDALADSAWAQASAIKSAAPGAVWAYQVFGSRKATRYTPVQHQGRAAIYAESEASTSGLRLNLQPQTPASGLLQFSWWVDQLNPKFDLRDRETSDAVTNIILSFDGDKNRWSAKDRMLSELSLLTTGEPMPYATLVYVWDPQLPVGTVLSNAYTSRMRLMVVESGPERLGRWLDYERDIAADFRLAFGEDPGPLQGLGLMTDSNNTQSEAQAWFGPLTLTPPTP